MKGLKLWWLRTFKVITNERAEGLGLKHLENIYGDMINRINCRSIWEDEKGRTYRVSNLYPPPLTKQNNQPLKG